MQPLTLAKRGFLLLSIAIIAFYLYGLGFLPFVGPDEPRYAQVAREMLLRHDPFTPTLGGHTWFEKPALLYWLMMGAYKLFGVSEFAARIGPAFCGLLTILAVWLLAHEYERAVTEDHLKGIARLAVIIQATMLGLIVFSKAASFDIVVTMTVTWSLAFFALNELKPKKLFLAAFYVCIGLSLLAKGLVGFVIPVGVVGLYLIVRRRKPSRSLRFSLIWGFPLALMISAIWYGPVIARHGWPFIDEFFIQHHFKRYISNKYQHPQPVFFYFSIIPLLTLPWTLFLVDALLRIRAWGWREDDAISKLRLFSFCWLVLPILFFSFSGSKLPAYILPVLPPASILIADRIARMRANNLAPKWPVIATGVVSIVLAAAGIFYAIQSGFPSVSLIVVWTLPLIVGGVIAIALARQPETAVTAIAIAILVMVAGVLRTGAPYFARAESTRDLLRMADAQGYGEASVFTRRGGDRTCEFYASGRVVYDTNGEPVALEEPFQVRDQAKRRCEKVLVLVPLEYIESYKGSSDFRILGDNGKYALVAAGN